MKVFTHRPGAGHLFDRMKLKTAPTGTATETARRTSVALNAEHVAKLRACLKAVGSRETLEEFIEDLLADTLKPANGFFDLSASLLPPARQAKARDQLDRILSGDRRLVHPGREPMARNVTIYGQALDRLDTAAKRLEMGRNGLASRLVEHGLAELAAGRIAFEPA